MKYVEVHAQLQQEATSPRELAPLAWTKEWCMSILQTEIA